MVAARGQSGLARAIGLARTTGLVAAAGLAVVAVVAAAATPVASAVGDEDEGEATPSVAVTTVDDEITPVIADHLCDGVDRAADDAAEALVVRLDTPGGLDAAMRDIVSCFLEAEVPVVVHVAPRGARAASAGAIITLASHVAAMAPGTTIGAATPVGLDGSDLSDKIVNDAAALAESVAEIRGRDAAFAVDIVREGLSVPATAALEVGAVDLISPDLEALLADLDGREVTLADGRTVILRTADATVDEFGLTFARQILQWLSNPNLTFLLLSIGGLAILYELSNPGIGAGGVIGVIAIIAALFSLSVLPVDAAGILLFVLAMALFVGELFVPGTGILAALGTASLAVSAIFLFDRGVGARVSPAVWIPTVLVAGGAALLAGVLVARSRRRPKQADSALIGTRIDPDRLDPAGGQAFVAGAWWAIRLPDDGEIDPSAPLAVIGRDGLTLIVEPIEAATDSTTREQGEEGGAV